MRLKGVSNGWWIWKVENNLMLDVNGDFLETMTQQLKHLSTKERWNGNEKEADGILDFAENMRDFRGAFYENNPE